jgi:hypothetical protein
MPTSAAAAIPPQMTLEQAREKAFEVLVNAGRKHGVSTVMGKMRPFVEKTMTPPEIDSFQKVLEQAVRERTGK